MENKSKGIVLILLSALFFAFMAATVKSIPNIPVTEKIFFRNIFGFIFALIIVKKKGKPLLGNNKKLLLFRSFCGLLGVACYFLALSKIRLADAVILNKLSPFFILILSYIFLKEKIKKFQVVSLILAILGAGFVIKPGLNLSIIPSLIALASALFAGCAYTAIRYLRHTDAPETIVLYFTFISTISMIPFMLSGQFVIPNQAQITRLISLGIFATSAQFLMTHAYRYAPASELSIYTYANIVFSSIIGLLVWNETLDFMTVIGALLIITSAILNYIVNNNIKLKKLP